MQFVAAKELGVVLVVGLVLVHPLFCKKFNLIESTCSKKKSYMANMFQKKKLYDQNIVAAKVIRRSADADLTFYELYQALLIV